MIRYALSRRNFLAGIGAATGLGSFLETLEAQEAAPQPIQRFLMMQRPVGTVYDNFWPTANGADMTLSRILKSFEPLKSRMVVMRDLKLPSANSKGGGHEAGTVLMVTGKRTVELYPGNGGDDPVAEGPSVDQLFVKQAAVLKGRPVESLQLSCDNRADTPEVSTRHLSYSGRKAPIKPYYQPQEAYQRVFGTLMPGGTTPGNMDALAVARLQKKSVLDFARRDLARLRTLAPASQKERLDAHEAAIRELEVGLDAAPSDPASCGVAMEPPQIQISTKTDPYGGSHEVAQRDDQKHHDIGQLHLSIIKAAFKCDLTRVVTFQWSPGTNHVSFGDLWPPNPSVFKVHHTTSHDADSPDMLEFLTRVEEWYTTRVSTFLQDLAKTVDPVGDGAATILDNTLVPWVTEVGTRRHNWDNMPWVFFGGPGVKLQGGRIWTNNRTQRSTNDVWMACARVFGLPDFVLGEEDLHTTAVDGLFTA